MATDPRGTAQVAKEQAQFQQYLTNPNETQVSTSVSLMNQGLKAVDPTQVSQAAINVYNAQEVSRTPVMDEAGNVTGWNVTTKDGKTTFQANPNYKSGTTDLSKDQMDAFALLKSVFTTYGLDSLIPDIENYMKQNMGPNQATYLLKQTAAYKTRFAGNEKRRTAGLNTLTEAEYLSLEDAYTSTLRSYGQQNLLGTDRATRQSKMADIIGSDISAVEFKDRIDMAVTRVKDADPEVKTQLKAFYNIGDVDLVGYFLNPAEALPTLQEKVKTAEIGSAAVGQGLKSTYAAAVDLAKYGVDLATARQGYATIAEQLPTTEKLSKIYSEENITYGQAQAEAETFKGLASEKRKRQALAAKEMATFSGSSGTSKGAFSSNYLNRQQSAGQF